MCEARYAVVAFAIARLATSLLFVRSLTVTVSPLRLLIMGSPWSTCVRDDLSIWRSPVPTDVEVAAHSKCFKKEKQLSNVWKLFA